MTDLFTREFRVRLSETDYRSNLKAESIFNYFQDVGSEHAALLGVSVNDLLARNYTWVMLKYNVSIVRCPVWNECIVVDTWRAPHKNLYELREFVVSDRNGTILIRGKSAWVIMDCDTRKPVRLNRCMPENLMEAGQAITNDLGKLSTMEQADQTTEFKIRLSDLDFNKHVNNSIYVGWALNSIPAPIHAEYRLKNIQVNYINEVTYGNNINASIAPVKGDTNPEFIHSISTENEKKELARLKTTWEPFRTRQ